ncbi:MAG: hypothetical protein J7559_03230 [Cohnella sp.]|nr:hypothetical protein [Cohnella sp.]
MGIKKIGAFAALALMAGLFLGCVGHEAKDDASEATEQASAVSTAETLPETVPVMQSPSAAPVESASMEMPEREDDSIRAIGTAPGGRLLVQPASKATVVALGAPSCYGQAEDLKWQGDYKAVWEPDDGGDHVDVMAFPADAAIIQQSEEPIEMWSFVLDGTDILSFIPRYADCHGTETYFFGVEDGQAFSIPIVMSPDLTVTNIAQDADRLFHVDDGEIVMKGGYAAGNNTYQVYHLRYDSGNRQLTVVNTELVDLSQ